MLELLFEGNQTGPIWALLLQPQSPKPRMGSATYQLWISAEIWEATSEAAEDWQLETYRAPKKH